MNKVIVREAKVEDTDAFAKIHVETWQCAYRGQVPDSYLDSLSVEKRKTMWKESLLHPQPGTKHFAGEIDGKVAGFCTVGNSRDEDADSPVGELWGIYVDSNMMGLGVGSALMKEGLKFLKSQGFKKATLWVLASNAKSIGFYEHKGWKADGKTKTDHQKDFDLHEIRLVISII